MLNQSAAKTARVLRIITAGVKLNIKKKLLLVLSSVENLQKIKLKEFCYVS